MKDNKKERRKEKAKRPQLKDSKHSTGGGKGRHPKHGKKKKKKAPWGKRHAGRFL